MTNPQFISIIGQTATGKTQQAFNLAEHWCQKHPDQNVVVISADSKQVYSELKILSGADIPANFNQTTNPDLAYPFFSHPSLPITLHGTGFLTGDQDWSVGHFHNLVKKLIKVYENALFIMVGGTGLYHQQIYHPAETLHIKPNLQLRTSLEPKNLGELQVILANKNPTKFNSMNHSDQNNPRRLIRAIEVSEAIIEPSHYPKIEPLIQLGLTTTEVEIKIQQRVLKRLEQNVIKEVEQFEQKYQENSLQAKATLGYQEICQFINQEIDQPELIKLWTLAETQYAKRQMTWWKKQPNIQWFDAKFQLSGII